jgi:hypothetical protein
MIERGVPGSGVAAVHEHAPWTTHHGVCWCGACACIAQHDGLLRIVGEPGDGKVHRCGGCREAEPGRVVRLGVPVAAVHGERGVVRLALGIVDIGGQGDLARTALDALRLCTLAVGIAPDDVHIGERRAEHQFDLVELDLGAGILDHGEGPGPVHQCRCVQPCVAVRGLHPIVAETVRHAQVGVREVAQALQGRMVPELDVHEAREVGVEEIPRVEHVDGVARRICEPAGQCGDVATVGGTQVHVDLPEHHARGGNTAHVYRFDQGRGPVVTGIPRVVGVGQRIGECVRGLRRYRPFGKTQHEQQATKAQGPTGPYDPASMRDVIADGYSSAVGNVTTYRRILSGHACEAMWDHQLPTGA